ncbi:phospholipase A [Psychromonas ossibalaenae]|uniref:phospholipase A n=1 Tax=Psychromonas ossibalaenae TaxID=444922 RepID=UPI00037CDB3D|nr:phospholipase A [Psychromonas ossibalaenae]
MRFIFSLFILLYSFPTLAKQSAVDQRLQQEKNLEQVNFSITPHKPTYILPFNYNDKIDSYDVYRNAGDDHQAQNMEMKFQISFKMPIAQNIADLPLSVYFAYTQLSFWQAYNTEQSSPFRETNYEPEVFALWQQDQELGAGWKFKLATLSFTHQSNGRSEPISRSWNRFDAKFLFEKNDFIFVVNPWHRISESAEEDNNPDLLDYYGHGKMSVIYKRSSSTFTLTSRNNLESGFSKGSTEFSWSFPIHGNLRGYLQVFSGYGNSMIEYNEYTNTIGLGISLTDWL